MILNRMGNKRNLAKQIQSYFPEHSVYIEPFFGAGGMFFNKRKVKYNVLNDLDDDVFNLFMVVMNQKEAFRELLEVMPINDSLLQYWKKNKETDPIKKAIRFLFLSNGSFMGMGSSLRCDVGINGVKKLQYLDRTHELLKDCHFFNKDFEKFFNSIEFVNFKKENCFAYLDPPYLDTRDNYSDSFNEELSMKLFDTMDNLGIKYAMSEFDHPFIIEQAKKRGLYIHVIGERKNLKNKRTEILITNYGSIQLSLF